jgi:hypothetical protein
MKWYDHPTPEGGDPTADLRDALVKKGVTAVLAHTGGGVMCVAVELNPRFNILIGADCVGSDVCMWGYDLNDENDPDGYVGGDSFQCSQEALADEVEAKIKALQEEWPESRDRSAA